MEMEQYGSKLGVDCNGDQLSDTKNKFTVLVGIDPK